MIKNNKFTIGISLLFILIGATFLFNRDNYEEPTEGMEMSAGVQEEADDLNYWVTADFIPKAQYTISLVLHLPVEQSESVILEPLQETTFRADEAMVKFEGSISVEEIEAAILDVDSPNFKDLERVAENWQDYEYVIHMHRTKFGKTYDSVFLNTEL